MNINIIGMAYSGQALDVELLRHQLENLGHCVHVANVEPLSSVQRLLVKTGLHQIRRPKFDLNIFIQQPRNWWVPLARKSVIIPNPDWIHESELENLKKIDVVWCKTRNALNLFTKLGHVSQFLGFTSPVAGLVTGDTVRNYQRCLHVAGSSELKGTLFLIDEWSKNPQWPVLTIVSKIKTHMLAAMGVANIKLIKEKIPADDLAYLRMSHGIHIQISETEGYGHVISESMASGAVVVTLDAEPMNELINQQNGFLVQARHIGKHYLAERYAPVSSDFQHVMNTVFSSPEERLAQKSFLALKDFVSNKSSFEENLFFLLSKLEQ